MVKKEISGLKRMIGKFASRQVIEKVGSEVNNMLEVVKVRDTLMLNSANTNYSFGGLHRVFQKAFKKLKIHERQIRDVLILGFGTGSIASILHEELGMECMITAVEKDPQVLKLGRKYFNTGRYTGLEIIEADAADFMAKNTRSFDLVIVDVYVDFEVPVSCETSEFVSGMEKCLNTGGMMLFNKLIYNHKARKEAAELEKKFETLNGKISVIKVRESVVNKVIVLEKGKRQPVTSDQ